MLHIENQQDYEKLVRQVNEWAHSYYTLGETLVSDSVYDQAYHLILEYEKSTGYTSPLSPTHRVGDKTLDGFAKGYHINPMMSIQDVFSVEEVTSWVTKIQEDYGKDVEFSIEPKYDGLSLNLLYSEGNLISAITRGDGRVGEIVSSNTRYIKGIPMHIPYGGKVEIRGEVVIMKDDFDEINESRLSFGKQPFSNERNAAAGALRSFESKMVKLAKLHFCPYAIGFSDLELKSHTEQMKFVFDCGFKNWEKYPSISKVSTLNEIVETLEKINMDREFYPMCLDGAVVKVNMLSQQSELGVTSKFPKWVIAFKFAAQESESYVRNVVWQVGKTGALTPVAEIDPVEINGATVSRATLNNLSEIKRLDIRLGDKISIIRSGDVIPKIISSWPLDRNGSEVAIQAPEVCPCCGHPVEKRLRADGVDQTTVFCSNSSCPDVVKQKIIYAASRSVLNIASLGDSTISELVDKGIIKNVLDLFTAVNVENLLALEGFQIKKAQKVFDSIQSMVGKTSFASFINSLNIELIGVRASKVLAKNESAVKMFALEAEPNMELLKGIDEIGDAMASNIFNYLINNADFIRDYKLVLNPKMPEFSTSETTTNSTISGKTFVITGSLSKPRDHFANLIESLGGKVSSSVSKKTDYVLVGSEAGSKLEKAQALNIVILNEDDFLNLIK